MLAMSPRLLVFAYNTAASTDGARCHIVHMSEPFFVFLGTYNEAFEYLQRCAPTRKGIADASTRDSFPIFFVSILTMKNLRMNSCILAVQIFASSPHSKSSQTVDDLFPIIMVYYIVFHLSFFSIS